MPNHLPRKFQRHGWHLHARWCAVCHWTLSKGKLNTTSLLLVVLNYFPQTCFGENLLVQICWTTTIKLNRLHLVSIRLPSPLATSNFCPSFFAVLSKGPLCSASQISVRCEHIPVESQSNRLIGRQDGRTGGEEGTKRERHQHTHTTPARHLVPLVTSGHSSTNHLVC